MKLLIATGLYPPDIGGPATYTVFLEKYADELGVEFVVVPFNRVRRLPPFIRHLAYIVFLLVKSRRCRMLYALDTVSVGVPTCIVSFITRKPYLLRVPGDYAWEQGQQRFGVTHTLDTYLNNQKQAPFQVRMLARIQSFVARHAHHVVVPSDYMKRVVSHWGVKASSVTRIYSALKTIDVPESREELRERFGYRGFVIVTAGRLVPWKGMRALIDAAKMLYDNGIPVSLHVIGDGVCREDLVAHTKKCGATSYVHFHGALSREALAKRIKGAHVFALNTSYEGLSHQLIEVMSLGVPIVTTPVGGNLELIEDGRTGLLVHYDNVPEMVSVLSELYRDIPLGRTLAEASERAVLRFHETEVVKELQRFFERV